MERPKTQTLKMAPVFKIAILENERSKAIFHVLIEPRLPNLDSFKEALFMRNPLLKSEPLYMFYNGKFFFNIL